MPCYVTLLCQTFCRSVDLSEGIRVVHGVAETQGVGRKEKWKVERCTPNTPQETGRDTEGGKEGRKNGRKEERSTQNTLPAETQECYITRPSI